VTAAMMMSRTKSSMKIVRHAGLSRRQYVMRAYLQRKRGYEMLDAAMQAKRNDGMKVREKGRAEGRGMGGCGGRTEGSGQ
jgi:hypothetical protein